MRAERDPMSGKETGAAALGVEERSDETPRAEVGQRRPAPDPEVVAKPTRRQFTAESSSSANAPFASPGTGARNDSCTEPQSPQPLPQEVWINPPAAAATTRPAQ